MRDFSRAEKALKAEGLRITRPRLVVYDYLLDNKTHQTCDQIYHSIVNDYPHISFSSVYNVTEKLSNSGLILKLVSPCGEMHYDSTNCFHGHFYCLKCSCVLDLDLPDVKSFYKPISGSTTTSITISAEGICPMCSKNEQVN